MPKLKLTKTALKAEKDDLKRFSRFLPTLQLKKQQLQLEMRKSQALFDENVRKQDELRRRFSRWIALLGDDKAADLIAAAISITGVDKGENNIAGVTVPVFNRVEFAIADIDLFAADYFTTYAVRAVCELISLAEAGKVLKIQHELLHRELRTTTQRVNLFEKVKIPECRENIRKIRIYMGDQDTSAVARSKIAKSKSANAEGGAA